MLTPALLIPLTALNLLTDARADQGYLPPSSFAVPVWTPETRPCQPELASAPKLPHRHIVLTARLRRPVVFERVRDMSPRDRYRVFDYALRLQLSGKRGALMRAHGRNLRAEFDEFFAGLRPAGLSRIEELRLLRQAMEFGSFAMSPDVVATLDYRPDDILAVFAHPSSLRTVLRLEKIGLWGRLDDRRRARILAHLLDANGWGILGEETRLLDADRRGLFRLALASRGTRDNPQTIAAIRQYIGSPTLPEEDREALFVIAVERNVANLTRSLLARLDHLNFGPEASLRLKTSILVNARIDEVMRVLQDAPAGLPEDTVLAALRRLLALGASGFQRSTLVRIGADLVHSPDVRFAYLNELVPRLSAEVLSGEVATRYALTAEDVYRLYLRAPPDQSPRVLQSLRARFGDDVLPRIELSRRPRSVLAGAKVNEHVKVEELRANLLAYQRTYPGAVAEHEATIPWDRVWKEDTGLSLIKHILGHPLGGTVPYTESGEVISDLLFGRVIPDFVASLKRASDDRVGTLYELVLNAVETRARPVLPPTLAVDPALWRKKNLPLFIEFLTAVRDWQMLNRRTPEEFGTTLDRANVEPITLGLRERLVEAIRAEFRDSRLDITSEKLATLRNLWGNLEPIFTLSSRYAGSPGWRPSLTVLARIFTAELAGTFATYKYEGFPGDLKDQRDAAAQLRVLDTPERVRAWRTNLARAEVVVAGDGGAAPSMADLRAVAVAGIRNGLAGHVRPGRAKSSVATQMSFLTRVRELPDLDLRKAGVPAEDGALILLQALLREPADEEIQAYTAYLLRHGAQLKIDHQVYEDLRAIRAAYVTEGEAARVQVIVTTAFDDAKTLLMTGDLVQTSSCQNFRTGGLAQTLPSYVIDANVKGLASFALKAVHFQSASDFGTLVSALKAGVDEVAVAYEGGRRRFHFTTQTGVTVTTLPLDKAHYRRLLRLGATKRAGTPGLFVEQSYQQTHDWLKVMKAQTASIVDAYHRAIGTDDDGPIRIEGTRNPLGGWSDAVWGVRQGAFLVERK